MRLRTRGHDFTLPFVKYNFNKNCHEPCTIIFRMCSSGLSYGVSQCVLNVLLFFVISSTVQHVHLTCLLNYLLTYFLVLLGVP